MVMRDRTPPARRARSTSTYPLLDLFALTRSQQSSRLHQQDKNQKEENDRIAVGGTKISHHHHFRDANQDSTEGRTWQVSDAADHRRNESLETGIDPHQRVDGGL